MKFSYKNWKKVSSEKDYTIFQNHRGDELKVAHDRLSPKVRGELASLPVHMKDGGKVKKDKDLEVEPLDKEDEKVKDIELPEIKSEAPAPAVESAESLEASPSSAIASEMSGAAALSQPLPANYSMGVTPPSIPAPMSAATPLQPIPAGIEPQQPVLAAAPSIAPAPQVPGAAPVVAPANDEMSLYQKGISEQTAGMAKEAQAIGQQGAAEAKALEESQAAQKSILTEYEVKSKGLQDEYNGVLADYKAGHIDPNHMWANKSTPSKIATIVGILASGLGAGMSGQENLAIKALNAEIDRDLDAQKANMNQKGSILGALTSQMGSLRAGTEMLRSIKLGVAAEEMKKVAALSKDPLAKAKLLEESGKLHMAAAPVMAKMAAQQTVNSLMNVVNKDPSKAPQLFEALRKVSPEAAKDMQDRYVPGIGFALKGTDADKMKEVVSSNDTTSSAISELLQMSKKGSSFSPADRAKAETTAQLLKGSLNKMVTGGGPMSAQEQELIQDIARNPLKIMSLTSANEAALKQLQSRSDAWVKSQAKSFGLNVPSKESQLTPQQQSFVKFARENPKDPRSPLILQKLGIE